MTTSQPQVTDDVVRKIQLLLNLAERAEGNEAEAAAAMTKAQDILARYNLDLATVQDAVVAGGTNATKAEAVREKREAKRNATYAWTPRPLSRGGRGQLLQVLDAGYAGGVREVWPRPLGEAAQGAWAH